MAYQGNSIVDYLSSIGQDSSFNARKQRAASMGIQNYTGTAAQNTQMLNSLRGSQSSKSRQPDQPSQPQQDNQSTPSGPSQDDIRKGLVKDISNAIISLENKLKDIPGVSFSQQELDNFLSKAVEQVTPYYNEQRKILEAGVREGTIQSMENLAISMRDSKTSLDSRLASLDITQAQTEEEVANKLADITASRDENLALKRDDWKNRIDVAKNAQVRSDILTSGVGQKQIGNLATTQQLEENTLQARAQRDILSEETKKKYDLQTITLARQTAEQERTNKLGSPAQQADTEKKIRETLGLPDTSPIADTSTLIANRNVRNISTARPEQLTALEEQKKIATESRRLSLQAGEADIKTNQYNSNRNAILSQIAAENRKLSLYNY